MQMQINYTIFSILPLPNPPVSLSLFSKENQFKNWELGGGFYG